MLLFYQKPYLIEDKKFKYRDSVMIKDRIPAIKKLSPKEKMLLAGELWDEVLEEQDIELTTDQKRELDKRIKYAREHPDEMISWEQVQDEIRKKYGS